MSDQVAATPAPRSPLARVFGIIVSPGETYEDVARHPAWLFPLLCYFVAVAIGFGVYSMKADWVAIATEQIENFPLMSLAGEAQKDQAIQRATANFRKLSNLQITASGLLQNVLPGIPFFFHGMAILYATLFVMMGSLADLKLGRAWLNLLLCLLVGGAYLCVAIALNFAFQDEPASALIPGSIAAVAMTAGWLWLLDRHTRKNPEFRKVLAVCAHASAIFILGALALGLVSMLADPGIGTPPDRMVKSNLGAIAGITSGALGSLLGSLDLFTVWALIVLSIGLRVVTRMSAGVAAALTFLPWGLWVLVKLAWAAAVG